MRPKEMTQAHKTGAERLLRAKAQKVPRRFG